MHYLSRFSLLALASALILTSCDKLPRALVEGNWLIGSWVLDREKTLEAFSLNNQKETPAGGVVGELARTAIRNAVDSMMKPMENVTLVFTETELVEKASGYSNKPKTYEIVARPGVNQIKTLDSNDTVRIYHREEPHIWFHLNGNEKFQVYLKPVVP
jgi:hypothetical protein